MFLFGTRKGVWWLVLCERGREEEGGGGGVKEGGEEGEEEEGGGGEGKEEERSLSSFSWRQKAQMAPGLV